MNKAPDAAEVEAPEDSVTVTLSTPVKAFGKRDDTVTLRRPLGKDIKICGFPLRIHGDGSFEFIAHIIARYIERLGGMTAGAVDALPPEDWIALQSAVTDFFKTSPTSGSEDSPELD